MLCFYFQQKNRIDFIIWVQSSAKNEFTYVISGKRNRSRINYLIVDNALDVIINFIYWEFHMYIITEIYYKMKPLLASLLNLS